jgi:hypothetical protein
MSNIDGTSTVAARMNGTDSDSLATRSDNRIESQPLERVTDKTKPNVLESSRSQNGKEGSGEVARDSAEPQVYLSTANAAQTDEDVLGADVNPSDGTLRDPFVVDWDRDDPENPNNWSKRSRWLLTCQVCNKSLGVRDIHRMYSH